MKTILLILCWILVATFARAGESDTYSVSNPAVRAVNGKNFNVNDRRWVGITGAFEDQHEGGIILRQEQPDELLSENRAADGKLVSRSTRRVPDKLILVKNFGTPGALELGQRITCKALPIGDVRYGGSMIEAYDCGVPTKTEAATSSRVLTAADARTGPTVTERQPDATLRPIKEPVPANVIRSEEEVILENLGPVGKKAYLSGFKHTQWPLTTNDLDKGRPENKARKIKP